MRSDSLDAILSSIDEKTVGSVLKERKKRMKTAPGAKVRKTPEGAPEEYTVIEESKSKNRWKGVLKAVSVTAAVAMIAVFAYLCYLPIYMQNHGLTPAGTGKPERQSIELPDSCFDRTREDRLTFEDKEDVKEGMTFGQICNIIGKPTGTIEGDKLCLVWDVFGKDAFLIYFSKNTDAEEFDPYNDLTAYYMMSYDLRYEVTVEVTKPGRDEPYDYVFRCCRDEFTDASLVKVGMTCEEVEAALPKNTYSVGLFSKRGIKYYVNDKETGHVFFVYCEDGIVTGVRDSGTDAGHAAPESSLEKLHNGMSFDEVVDILGSPIHSFLPEGRLSVTFKVKDRVTAFYFTQKYDDEYGVTDNVLCNCAQTVYRYGKDDLLCGYYDVYRADTVSEEDAGKISAGMTFGKVCEMIGSPIRHEEFGADEVTPCWRLGMNTWLRIRFVPTTYTVTDPLTEFVAEVIDTEVLNCSIGYPDPCDRDFKAADRFDKNDLKTWFDPYREAELDTDAVNKIAPDMTFEELVDLLGRPQRGASPAEPGIKCNMQWEYSGGYTLIVTFDTNGNCVPVCDMTVVRCQLYDWNIVESSPNTNPVIIDIHE